MTETLRDKEELLRIESENVRKAREELAVLKRKVEQHEELMSEKDRGVQVSITSPLKVRFSSSRIDYDVCMGRFCTTRYSH